MSAIIATLRAASGLSDTADDSQAMYTLTPATAAQLKDGSDATFSRVSVTDDAAESNPWWWRQEWTFDTATIPTNFVISKIALIVRHKQQAGVVNSLYASINGTQRGTPVTPTGTITNTTFEFTTDPADSQPWTQAKLNAQKFGLYADGTTLGVGTATEARAYELTLQVHGDYVYPASELVSTGAVEGGTPTWSPLVVPVGAIEATSAVESPTSADNVPDSFSPTATTILAHAADGGSALVTLRGRGVLGDGDTATGTSSSSSVGPAAGTMIVSTGGVADTSVDGLGDVGGVRFYALARLRQDAPATASNARFRFNTTQNAAMLAAPPSGTYAAVPAYAVVQSDVVTTRDGTNPWTWQYVFAALVDLSVRVDYNITLPGNLAQLDVAEVWVEVLGPMGSRQTPIEAQQGLGRVVKVQTVHTQL